VAFANSIDLSSLNASPKHISCRNIVIALSVALLFHVWLAFTIHLHSTQSRSISINYLNKRIKVSLTTKSDKLTGKGNAATSTTSQPNNLAVEQDSQKLLTSSAVLTGSSPSSPAPTNQPSFSREIAESKRESTITKSQLQPEGVPVKTLRNRNIAPEISINTVDLISSISNAYFDIQKKESIVDIRKNTAKSSFNFDSKLFEIHLPNEAIKGKIESYTDSDGNLSYRTVYRKQTYCLQPMQSSNNDSFALQHYFMVPCND